MGTIIVVGTMEALSLVLLFWATVWAITVGGTLLDTNAAL